ncbi:MAG: nucleotidyltransferase domain-containing protein [Candidatus Omnitrophica bacterium]|nr:nucleotidyltransferase domain-containing protein [Candidatus Omnitrophota bacterium]
MAYFFTNPEARLYLREIAVQLDVDPTNLSRELRKLEQEGVFVSERNGLQKYFSLNKNYALYEELRSMVFKTVGVQGALTRLLRDIQGIHRAFIYGSFAKNSERAGSDVDLCLIIDKKYFREDHLLEKLHKLEQKLGREINYSFFSVQEWESKIRSKDSFVLGLMKGKRIELIHEKD